MPATVEQSAPAATTPAAQSTSKKKVKRSWRRIIGTLLIALIVLLVAARLAMPTTLRWYVNRTIDQNPLYDGEIGDIDVHLYRGSYTIKDIRLVKTTGNVPVPLFAAKRVALAIQWDALFNGKVVGRILFENPELNFVDGNDASQDQTGAGGPWLQIIDDLFPFRINEALIRDGSIHFRAFDKDPPVDMYISQLNASMENLSNIHDDVTPLIATVKATGKALDHADFQYQMKLDPSSYNPTFQMAVRLIGLDVTKTNDLARAYGAFDFEHGFFDLVVEMDCKEGQVEGYVKPLFRNLKVLSLKNDLKEDDVFHLFWEAVVGTVSEVLKNQKRDQVATVIPFKGDLTNPRTGLLSGVGNILYNAFVRAYLPRLQGMAEKIDGMEFSPGSISDPVSPSEQ